MSAVLTADLCSFNPLG